MKPSTRHSLPALVLAALLALSPFASAAEPPAPPSLPALSPELLAKSPVNIMPADVAGAVEFRDNTNAKPAPTAVWTTGSGGGAPTVRVETAVASKSSDHVSLRWPLGKAIKRGDVLLARFLVRTEYARQESGEAAFEFSVQRHTPSFSRHVLLPLSAGPDWAAIEIPFTADGDTEPDQGYIQLNFGIIPQAMLVSSIEILNFGNSAKLSDLPQTKFTYKGREADAAWRKAALERIEKIRTAPMTIRVIDAAGAPIPDAKVEVRLARPAFLWGTEVDAGLIVKEGEAGDKYRTMILELFDTTVIGNGMKWPKWSGSAASRAQSIAAMDWLHRNGLRTRGHNLVWPGDKFSPRRVQQMPAPRAELPLLVREHIRDIMTATRGQIVGWDVINEMLHEKDYFKYMPETEAAEWFKLARQMDPAAKLFINDYGMLNSRNSPNKIKEYLALVARLRSAGAPIDAMGVQGHVGRQVRTPTDVLSDLDLLATAGLELQITEFDVNTPDEQLQADYTRDFVIALYSHPSVTGFTMWGFWQGAHWKPDAAMFRRDWSEKPNAKVWRDLVRTQWLTHVTSNTDAAGTLATRGHLGDYEFTVTAGEKTARQMRPLTLDGATITIQVP